jgi:hypothetical protein
MRRLSVDDLRAFRRPPGRGPGDEVIHLDSFQDPVTNDSVPSLFLIPGVDETRRVNGRAELVTDCDRLRRVVPRAGGTCALRTRGLR